MKFLAEMLHQHVVEYGPVLIALRRTIRIHGLLNACIQIRAICEAQLLDQEIVLYGLKLALLRGCNG